MEDIVLPRYEVTLTENKMQELEGIIPKKRERYDNFFYRLAKQE